MKRLLILIVVAASFAFTSCDSNSKSVRAYRAYYSSTEHKHLPASDVTDIISVDTTLFHSGDIVEKSGYVYVIQ